jgi:hypothetical protein
VLVTVRFPRWRAMPRSSAQLTAPDSPIPVSVPDHNTHYGAFSPLSAFMAPRCGSRSCAGRLRRRPRLIRCTGPPGPDRRHGRGSPRPPANMWTPSTRSMSRPRWIARLPSVDRRTPLDRSRDRHNRLGASIDRSKAMTFLVQRCDPKVLEGCWNASRVILRAGMGTPRTPCETPTECRSRTWSLPRGIHRSPDRRHLDRFERFSSAPEGVPIGTLVDDPIRRSERPGSTMGMERTCRDDPAIRLAASVGSRMGIAATCSGDSAIDPARSFDRIRGAPRTS